MTSFSRIWNKLRPIVLSFGLHAIVLGLLFVGLLRHPTPQAVTMGTIIQATLVTPPPQLAMHVPDTRHVERETMHPSVPNPSRPESTNGQPRQTQAHVLKPSPPPADTRNIGDVEVIAERDAELLKPHVQAAPNSSIEDIARDGVRYMTTAASPVSMLDDAHDRDAPDRSSSRLAFADDGIDSWVDATQLQPMYCIQRNDPNRNDTAAGNAFIDCLLGAAMRDWSHRWAQ